MSPSLCLDILVFGHMSKYVLPQSKVPVKKLYNLELKVGNMKIAYRFKCYLILYQFYLTDEMNF